MNQPNILDLIKNCDVEWKSLREIANVQRGASPRPISQYITDDNNGIPWIKIGDTKPDSKYVEKTVQKITYEGALKSRILKKGDFILSNSMSYGRPYILKIDGAIHDGWASISEFQQFLDTGYLYYYLSSKKVQNYWDNKINSGSVSNLNSEIIKSLEIPLPPLEIQQKIVKILDKFTELEATLEAELTLRKKQYEFYRNQLLTFDDEANAHPLYKALSAHWNGEVVWKSLGEILPIQRGRRVVRTQLKDNGIYPVYQNSLQPLGFFDDKNCRANMSFIISAGAAGEIGFSKTEFWAADDCYYFDCPQDLLNDRFLYYVLLTQQNTIVRQVRKASVPRLGRTSVENIKIPLPPLAVQQKIVEILDKFDTLTHSISQGLPREIELRRKQYEYYREQLLNFNH